MAAQVHVGNQQNRSNEIVVENIATFRRVQEPVEFFHIPEIPQRRKLTDASFLVTLTISIIVLLSCMIYSLFSSDIQRFIHGYDNCGNVCGQKNAFTALGPECSAQDMTDKPYLVYETRQSAYSEDPRRRYCASSCNNNFTEKFHRCFPRMTYDDDYDDLDFFEYVVERIDVESNNLIILCFSGLGFSVLALMLYRYFLNAFVWTMLWCSIGLMFALTGFLWYLYSDYGFAYLGASIVCTIISFVFVICILVLMLRIKLIIGFFEEATKIIFSMPLILLEPMLTFIANFVVIAIFVYTFLLMETSGSLQEEGTLIDYDHDKPQYESYAYIPDGAMTFAMCLSVIMLIWMLQFTLACQHMVISGAISAHYFARDKLALVSPIYNSFYNLIRFHLGTAAFGSFTITVVTVLKIFIRALSNDNGCLRLFYICFKPLEDLLKYLTSMGYIETAIHGQPLCRSGMRAITLIVSNLLSAVAMNAIGNLVFFMAKFVVVILTIGVGLLMNVSGVTLFFGGVAAFLCVHCIFVVFEIAVDTIFLCYCEDQCLNDGNINPYVTSLDLHNYIKKAQKLTMALEDQKKKKNTTK